MIEYRKKKSRHYFFLILSFILLIISLLISIFFGSAVIPPVDVIYFLFTDNASIENKIIDEVRLPRTLSAFAVGGVLALAGALMQVLLRNPLGDPYILGVSGGAATASLVGMLLGLNALWLTPLAFGGALFSILLVFYLGGQNENDNSNRLLLSGVIVAAGWGSLISLVLSIAPPMQLPGMIFWLIGDLSDALSPWVTMFVLTFGLIGSIILAPKLNIAVYGFQQAAVLGIEHRKLQFQLYFLASILSAAAVSIAGSIGFIGLIVPHFIRLLGCTDHRTLLPVSVFSGGSLLVLADTMARTVISPMQLPVGIITALIGIPIFLWLLKFGVKY